MSVGNDSKVRELPFHRLVLEGVEALCEENFDYKEKPSNLLLCLSESELTL